MDTFLKRSCQQVCELLNEIVFVGGLSHSFFQLKWKGQPDSLFTNEPGRSYYCGPCCSGVTVMAGGPLGGDSSIRDGFGLGGLASERGRV